MFTVGIRYIEMCHERAQRQAEKLLAPSSTRSVDLVVPTQLNCELEDHRVLSIDRLPNVGCLERRGQQLK
jgi:hypothetical protein